MLKHQGRNCILSWLCFLHHRTWPFLPLSGQWSCVGEECCLFHFVDRFLRVSLCNPDWTSTQGPPASAPRVLGSTTSTHPHHHQVWRTLLLFVSDPVCQSVYWLPFPCYCYDQVTKKKQLTEEELLSPQDLRKDTWNHGKSMESGPRSRKQAGCEPML